MLNFCINLPDPNSEYLQNHYYSKGRWPTIVAAEAFVQSFCIGSYLSPGAFPMRPNVITSANVIKNFTTSGRRYWQIYGTLDCDAAQINCTSSSPGAYDDGGQYDSVPFINCGHEPYSGPDASQHPGFDSYVEQAGSVLLTLGNGVFCMRICEGTTGEGEPCTAKNDTAGCQATFGINGSFSGFSFIDVQAGITITTSIASSSASRTSSSTYSRTSSFTSLTSQVISTGQNLLSRNSCKKIFNSFVIAVIWVFL